VKAQKLGVSFFGDGKNCRGASRWRVDACDDKTRLAENFDRINVLRIRERLGKRCNSNLPQECNGHI